MEIYPQIIPYQGSKRQIARAVIDLVPPDRAVFFEPFAGSAAVAIAAASRKVAAKYVIGDVLAPLVSLLEKIVKAPEEAFFEYETIWEGQLTNPRDYYNQIRDEFNSDSDPIKLLYLIARCVKNAVRFNTNGHFNQSPDNRRLGMHPQKFKERAKYVSAVLKGKSEFFCSDFMTLLEKARSCDFVYMDPPYQGTSTGKDNRYAKQLELESLVEGLHRLNKKDVPFALSFDGSCGTKKYGVELPRSLKLKKVLVTMGRSSQATLLGRKDETIESLYLSQNISDIHIQKLQAYSTKKGLAREQLFCGKGFSLE